MKINGEYTDTELLARLRADDKTAFDSIYYSYWDFLFQSAYKILLDRTLAEDVIQEVFIDFWSKRKQHEISNLKGFLYKATKFQVFKVIRHNKVVADYIEKDFILNFSTNDALDNLALKDLREALDRAIIDLPAKCKQIFELSRNGRMSSKEIASYLGISSKTVDNQLNIALKKIKASLSTSFVLLELILAYYSKR